jgi:hypothetical protein
MPKREDLIPYVADHDDRAGRFHDAVRCLAMCEGDNVAKGFAETFTTQVNDTEPFDLVLEQLTVTTRNLIKVKTQLADASNRMLQVAANSLQASSISASLAPKHPTPQERMAVKKLCAERIPTLVAGTSISQYKSKVNRVLNHTDGRSLTEEERLDIVRAKAEHDPDIYKSVSSSFGNKSITSVDQYFAELAILFRPDGYAFKDAVKSKKQRENQPAVDFMEEVEKLGYKYWVGVPDGVDVFSDIIDNMSSQHHPVMKNQLSIALNALSRSTDPNPITFQDLKRWAAHSDSEFAKRKAKKTDKLAQAAAAEFDGAGGRGRGRDPNFRGRGRDGQYRGRGRAQANFSEFGFAEFSPRAFTAELLPFDPEVLQILNPYNQIHLQGIRPFHTRLPLICTVHPCPLHLAIPFTEHLQALFKSIIFAILLANRMCLHRESGMSGMSSGLCALLQLVAHGLDQTQCPVIMYFLTEWFPHHQSEVGGSK